MIISISFIIFHRFPYPPSNSSLSSFRKVLASATAFLRACRFWSKLLLSCLWYPHAIEGYFALIPPWSIAYCHLLSAWASKGLSNLPTLISLLRSPIYNLLGGHSWLKSWTIFLGGENIWRFHRAGDADQVGPSIPNVCIFLQCQASRGNLQIPARVHRSIEVSCSNGPNLSKTEALKLFCLDSFFDSFRFVHTILDI